MQRTPLFSALLAAIALALACSGEESAPRAQTQTQTQKTPEQIAELEAECIKQSEVNSAEDLAAVAECLENARK